MTAFALIALILLQTDARILELGNSVQRTLAPGSKHAYSIDAGANQYLHVVASEKSIDVSLVVIGPGGEELATFEHYNGDAGTEHLEYITPAAGRFLVDVRSRRPDKAAGDYTVRLAELRAARPDDADRVATRRSFVETVPVYLDGSREEKERAKGVFISLAEKRHALDDPDFETRALNLAGQCAQALGQNPEARDLYARALERSKAADDKMLAAYAHANLGRVQRALGDLQAAAGNLEASLRIAEVLQDQFQIGSTLANLATVHDQMGQADLALHELDRALAIFRAGKNRMTEGRVLTNIGGVYRSIGAHESAIAYFEQALPIQREQGDKRGEAAILHNIGASLLQLGETGRAISSVEAALPLFDEGADREGKTGALLTLGRAHLAQNDAVRARERFDQAIELARATGNKRNEGSAIMQTALLHLSANEFEAARPACEQALAIFEAISFVDGQAEARSILARIDLELGALEPARTRIDAALATVESVRSQLSGQYARASFLSRKRGYYDTAVEVLMRLHARAPDAGHDAEALRVSERSKARVLVDTIAEARVNLRESAPRDLLAREARTVQLLGLKARERTEALAKNAPGEAVDALSSEIDRLTAERRDLEAQIRAASPRFSALTSPEPLTLAEIQSTLLDADTALVEYNLGDRRGYAWIVTKTSLQTVELAGRAEIEKAAREAHASIAAAPKSAAPDNAPMKRLSGLVLDPVLARTGAKRLVVVADGALQYIPFAALPSANGAPLVATREVVNLPSALTLAVQRRELAGKSPATKAAAILADPVFDPSDGRVAKNGSTAPAPVIETALTRSARNVGVERFDRLLATRKEAETIATLAKSGEPLRAVDFEASRTRALQSDLADYRIVHFATHGLIDSRNPELSGVVLSLVDRDGRPVDGFLRLDEICNMKLNADLVTLSACQTALGRDVRGEGLVGLTRGFMYAGARRVTASLWKVSDRATLELMSRFYRSMLVDGLAPAAALREAQNQMRRDPRWTAPYYWAGFVLQGDWR